MAERNIWDQILSRESGNNSDSESEEESSSEPDLFQYQYDVGDEDINMDEAIGDGDDEDDEEEDFRAVGYAELLSVVADNTLVEGLVDNVVVSDCFKSRTVDWNKTQPAATKTPARNILRIPSDRTPATGHVETPVDAFLLFITPGMIDECVKYTNIEGRRVKGAAWTNCTHDELSAVIGCLLYAGSRKENMTDIKILFDILEGLPILRACFSRNRFSSLLAHMRFDDKETRSQRRAKDLFAPIRYIWDKFQVALQAHYVPGEALTVDEQLVNFRGRCAILQYIPSKPDKYGIKIFWVCDAANAFPCYGIPYLGKGTQPRTANSVGASTVLNLVQRFFQSGRNVTCDNFFTDYDLAQLLLRQKMTLVGTVRRNKSFLPQVFKDKKHLSLHQSLFGFKDSTTLVSYQTKRNLNVNLLSTMHQGADVDASTNAAKPEIVLYYNHTKGGVDTMDKMAHAYTCKRKTKRWPMVIFFNMLDLSTIAARVIWKSKFPLNPLSADDSRKTFIMDVSKGLMRNHLRTRQCVPNLSFELRSTIKQMRKRINSRDSSPEAAPKSVSKTKVPRQRCRFCPCKKDRKTKTWCSRCKKNLCTEHSNVLCPGCINHATHER